MVACERLCLVLMLTGTALGWSPSIGSPRVHHERSTILSTHPATTSSLSGRQGFSLYSRGETQRVTTRLAVSVVDDITKVTPTTAEGEEAITAQPLEATGMVSTTVELDLQQKVINGLFLAAAFGYALYTILDIDHGMTRGWSASEIAMRIPLDNWGNYESALANKPVFTKTLINVIIYLLGDWLSQTAFAGKNVLDFDIKRTLRNGFIGLCFGPLVHQYYQFSDAILPPEDGILVRLQKIVMDQTIYLTVKCSIYISAVGLLAGDDWPTVKQRVEDKIGGVVLTAWKFWPIVHCITYGLIPARHRILWVNSVDLIWNAILASKAQKQDPELQQDMEAVLALESAQVGQGDTSPVLTEESSPMLVLDNKWVEEQREAVAEILSSTLGGGGGNTNMTSSETAIA